MYQCPKCDKGLTTTEVKNKTCGVCGFEFTVAEKTELGLLQENVLIARIADEVKRGKRRKSSVNYYETAINIFKAYLSSVVAYRRDKYCSFYLIRDGEIKCFLFRVVKREHTVRLQFNTKMRGYKDVQVLDDHYRKVRCLGTIRSQLDESDFERLMDVALTVYNKKSKQYALIKNADKKLILYVKDIVEK